MRRVSFVFAFAFAAVLPALILLPPAAGGGEKTAEKKTVVYSWPVNAGPLNPHTYLPNQMYAQEMVYEPLVRADADGNALPCLAERWETSADGRVYTFFLRGGVTFSDGEKFDAAAVVKNFDHILSNRRRHEWLDLTNRIASCEAVDDSTFRLVLNTPCPAALADLSLPRPFRFLSPAAFPDSGTTRDGIKAPAGTGRWKLVRSAPGEYDLFARNETHRDAASVSGRGEGAADEVLVKVIPDPVGRAVALQTGEIDLVFGSGQIDYDAFAAFRNDSAFATAVSRPMGTVAAALNTARGATRELAVRLAMQHAVDKDALVRGIFHNVQPRADFLFSPETRHCDAGLSPYEYDPARAAALLDGAGWVLGEGESVRAKNGEELAVDFCFVGNDAAQKAVAEAVQGQAAATGIRLNLIGEEEDAFARRQLTGDFGMILSVTWGPPFEPHAVLGSMRSASHADYQAQLGLPMKAELDAAITRALESTDEAERGRLYAWILRTLHEQAVYLPVHHSVLLSAHRAGVLENVRFGAGQTEIPFADFVKITKEN